MMFDAAVAATNEAVLGHMHAGEAGGHRSFAMPTDGTDADTSAAHRTQTASAAAHPQADAKHAQQPQEAPAPAAATASHEIIFIDEGVENYQQLAAEWASRGQVILINDQSDGVAQVEAALANESNVSAIHIVSHGEEGAFFLGTTRVDQASITGSLAGELAQIGKSLEPGGDILIYGCDFAEGDDGAAALHAFATATGADVAASTDLTGAADKGGDWTLEAHDGVIQTRALSSSDYRFVLDPNVPVPIAVTPDSLIVTDSSGKVIVTGSTGYTTSNGTDRSADVGAGATARWVGAATLADGSKVDLIATVVSISSGDFVRFNRPTSGTNGDDPTFLLRDASNGNSTNGDGASAQIVWSLVASGTNTPVQANVEFGILDIDGVGGNPNTRESVVVAADNLAYYTAERATDIAISPTLNQVTASGTQNENTVAGKPLDTKSEVTFDWTKVSSFAITYNLAANNGVTTQAQFYQDGNADFKYSDPVSVSIPRLDLDGDDSTAPGNDAHFTYTTGGPDSPIVDSDVVVSNPMDINSVTGASLVLTNAQAGDVLHVGTLPTGISATVTNGSGTISVALSGTASQTDYDAALRAITFANTAATPSTAQRVIDVNFSNAKLTSATAVSRIDINRPPADVGTLPDQNAQDANTVSYATKNGFSDPDGDTLTYSATGLPTGLTINSATGVISGTLDRSASQVNGGVYTVVVKATDPYNASNTQTFHIDVTNPPPTANNDSATTNENTPVNINVLANDTDPDGDPLSVTSASAQHGTVVRNADNTLTYTPNQYYYGSDTINYSISDGQGGTSSATVAVTIAHVNQAPVDVGTIPDKNAQDGGTPTYQTASAFSDPDGDTLAYSATGLPTGLTINGATGVISGTIDRSASQVNGGVYTVVVKATDPSNASNTQTFHINVTNPPPTANNDTATTNENVPVTINVLANDTDPDGDPLTVTSATAQHGSVVRNADGTITYTPTRYYYGSDTINYTISDGQGGTSSATVAVTVNHVNQAPRDVGTIPDKNANDADSVTYATASAFRDQDGDTLTYSVTGLPAGLAIDSSTGVISGTIDRSASQVNGGVYTVQVTAADPSNASAMQTFHINVANPAPTARNDSATTNENTPVTVNVLANDTDPDGDPLSVTSASAQHGTVVRNADNTLTYTPNQYYFGSDTISYAISDGRALRQ